MTGPTATCELWIDGTRVPDTGDDLLIGDVTALDGLSLTWGRDGQNEQPGPASLSVDLIDPVGRDDVLDVLHVGSVVQVWAEGTYTPDSGDDQFSETMDDPTFSSYTLGPSADIRYYIAGNISPATMRIVMNVSDVGSPHGHVLDTDFSGVKAATDAFTLTVPPRPFSPPNELPDAWDDIPRATSGEMWRYRFSIRGPAGATFRARPYGYAKPYSTGSGYSTYGAWFTKLDVLLTGDWQTFEYVAKVATSANNPTTWQAVDFKITGLDVTTWATQQGIWANDTRTWATTPPSDVWVDDVSIGRPSGGPVTRRVLVFSGQVSDLVMTPYGQGVTTLRATAMDQGAILGNTVIGDDPWKVQDLSVRANRIATLAGIPGVTKIRIDDPLGALDVSYRDVDAQPALNLFQDLAQTAGGVFWCATHQITGPYLWIENPAERAAVSQFTESGGLIVITGTTARGVNVVSACDVLQDGVAWRQDTGDVITVVAVTWLEQGTDDDGQVTTTERTVTLTDDDAVARYGTRRLSVSTELINATDATNMGEQILAQARAVAWRLDGLVINTEVTEDREVASVDDATREVSLLNLLDGTSRMGAAVTLVDMPGYAPRGAISSVYVEGGRYDFTDGFWQLALTTTPSSGQGHSATWGEIGAAHPEWTWADWDPSITWVQTFGVTV